MSTYKTVPPFGEERPEKRLGILLKMLMRERSVTGQELADQIGVSAPSISKILSGITRPRLGTFKKIVDALNCTEEQKLNLMDAYHGSENPANPLARDLFKRQNYYSVQLAENAWEAKEQVVKVMELRAGQVNFRMAIKEELNALGLSYTADYAKNGAATDFLVEIPGGETVAIESRLEIHRNLAQSYGFAYLVLERMNPQQVLIVTPYAANVVRPFDMPDSIQIVSLADLREHLDALLAAKK